MVFTHSFKIEENLQWVPIGGGSFCCFDGSGKFCAKSAQNHIELWESRDFHVPMTILPYPSILSCKNDVVCYDLAWSSDSSTLVGVVGSRVGYRKVLQRDVYAVAWDIESRQVLYAYRIPFSVMTMCCLPFENSRYVLFGTAEVECHLLLDTISGSVREVVFGGESVLFHHSDSDVPLFNCTLVNMKDVEPAPESDPDAAAAPIRVPDRADELWMARLDYQEGPLDNRKATSAVTLSLHSPDSPLLYVVSNSYGSAQRLQKISLSWNEASSDIQLSALSSVDLSGFTERVSSVVVNSDGSKLLLVTNNCTSLPLFNTSASTAPDLSLAATLLKAGDVIRTSQGEILPALTNSCIGASFVLSTWQAEGTSDKSKRLNRALGRPLLASVVEESVLVGVPTAGAAYANKLIVCRIPSATAASRANVVPSPAATAGSDDDDADNAGDDESSRGPAIEYRSIAAPRAGLTQIFVRPTPRITSTSTSLSGTSATTSVVGVDPVGRTLLLHWSCLRSDFPGPMYPIGYNLIQQCSTYLEAEDELDKVITSSTGTINCGVSTAVAGAAVGGDATEQLPVRKSRTTLDIGGVFDRQRRQLDSVCTPSSSSCSRGVLNRLAFTVADHFMPSDEKRLYRGGGRRRTNTDPLAAALDTAGAAAASSAMEVVGEVEEEGQEEEGEEEGTEGSGVRGSVFNFLGDGLGIPHKITTGDYFAKQKRERDLGSATLAMCQDREHVSKVLRIMKRDAVERAETQEDAKERARVQKVVRAEEKRVQAEAAKRVRLQMEREAAMALLIQQQQLQQMQQQQAIAKALSVVRAGEDIAAHESGGVCVGATTVPTDFVEEN